MKKVILLTSAALLTFGGIGSAQAQRVYYGHGWNGGYYHHHRGWGNGGALAAGLVGGALLGGLISAAATPAYPYPAYSYPAYGYRYGYGYPAYSYPAYGYRWGSTYPAYSYGYGYEPYSYGYYSAPVTTRVVYAPPVYRTRVVYREPRRYVRSAYYRNSARARVVRTVRRDVVTTGSVVGGSRYIRRVHHY